jgi:hypothetical protein
MRKALIQKGYLRRRPAERDRRSFCLELSVKARKLLAHDPLQEIVTAAEALSPEQRFQIVAGLATILERLRTPRGQPVFGVCGLSCRYLREVGTPGGLCYECELYAEPLSPEELAGLCVNYEPRPESPLPVAR